MDPDVSVVIATHNRPGGLATLLRALEAQTLDSGRFEVVVVDDGSDPPVRLPDGVRILRHDVPQGPGPARNTGGRAAHPPLVAFTDDDCTPAPGWLAALVQAANGDDDVVVQGPLVPPPGA